MLKDQCSISSGLISSTIRGQQGSQSMAPISRLSELLIQKDESESSIEKKMMKKKEEEEDKAEEDF